MEVYKFEIEIRKILLKRLAYPEKLLSTAAKENGFWAHNLAQNQAGQPADVLQLKIMKPHNKDLLEV